MKPPASLTSETPPSGRTAQEPYRWLLAASEPRAGGRHARCPEAGRGPLCLQRCVEGGTSSSPYLLPTPGMMQEFGLVSFRFLSANARSRGAGGGAAHDGRVHPAPGCGGRGWGAGEAPPAQNCRRALLSGDTALLMMLHVRAAEAKALLWP